MPLSGRPASSPAQAQLPRRTAVRGRLEVTIGDLVPPCGSIRLAGSRPGGRAYQPARVLSGGSGDVGRDYIGGVPVQRGAGPVIAHGGPRIGVGGGFLDIPQRDPSIERGGDERMPQGVRSDGLANPGAAGYPPDDPPGSMPVQPAAIRREEDRSFSAFPDGQVDRPGGARGERDGDNLAALARDDQGPVAALDTEGLDVGAGGL